MTSPDEVRPIGPDGGPKGAPPLLLLDSCCVINLFATRRVEEVVTDLPYRFAVADAVRREALYIRGGAGEPATMEPVSWEPVIASGRVLVLQLAGDDEEAAYVELAASLDDGEAATCALALRRRLGMATDDRKARRIMASRAPELPLLSTLDLIRAWCLLCQLTAPQITDLLRNVRERGRFVPPRSDPLREWWCRHLPPPQ